MVTSSIEIWPRLELGEGGFAMKRIFFAAALALASLTGTAVQADVASNPQTASAMIGTPVMIPFTLSSPGAVAGVNGELIYDTVYFENPRVAASSGASGFTVVGNEKEAGVFRFVAYANPTSAFNLNNRVLTFTLDVISDTSHYGHQTTITFNSGLSAASDVSGASYGVATANGGLGQAVTFNNIVVNIAETGTNDWMLYR